MASHRDPTPADGDPLPPNNRFFPALIVCGGLFCVTVLAMVATTFGDPQAPVNQFFNRHGGTIIAVEVTATLLVGTLSMVIDRVQTLRRLKGDREASMHRDQIHKRDEDGNTH